MPTSIWLVVAVADTWQAPSAPFRSALAAMRRHPSSIFAFPTPRSMPGWSQHRRTLFEEIRGAMLGRTLGTPHRPWVESAAC